MSIIKYNLDSDADVINITIPQNIKIDNNIYPVKSIGLEQQNFINYGSQGYLMYQTININVQEPIEYIYEGALSGFNLYNLTLPKTLKKIYKYALSGNRLSYIIIPPNVTELGDSVFAESSVNTFYFLGPLPTIGIDCFAVYVADINKMPVVFFSNQNVPPGVTNGSSWNSLIVRIDETLPYYPRN
jgi:hypothetical protein